MRRSLLALLLVCAAARADEAAEALTLIDAVSLALGNQPDIALVRSELTFAGGERLQAQGAFDGVLSADVSLQYLQQELSNTRKQALVDQREQISTLLDGIRERRSDAQTELDFVIAAEADPENIRLPNEDAQAVLDLYNRLIADAPTAEARANLERLRAEQLATRRAGLEATIAELDEQDATESERLARLGEAPEVEVSHDVVVGANYRKAYRNGWALDVFAQLTNGGANYRGKRKPTEFGGLGVADLYRSRVGVRLLTPFGRGATTAAAIERAANEREDAARSLLEHRLRRTVLDTILAYHQLSAAQAVHDVLRVSVERQRRLAELSEALIEADQLPRSERSRVLARDAEAEAQLARAAQALVGARLELGRSIGSGGDEGPLLPRAADALPEPAEVLQLADADRQRASAAALRRRQDFIAARQTAEGRAWLVRAATDDLKRRHDLSSELSLSGVAEGASVNDGLQDVFFGRWTGPSVKFAYAYERPSRNDAALGIRQQQQALEAQAELQAEALREDIARRIDTLLDSTAAAQEELRQRRAAVAAYQQAVIAERERLQLGSTTLIDLIQTEERLTSSLLSAISAQSTVAQLIAELRFQAGLLAPRQDGEYAVSQRELVGLDASELLSGG